MFVFYTPFPDDKKFAKGGIDKRQKGSISTFLFVAIYFEDSVGGR